MSGRILVVDDEDTLRMMLRTRLVSSGFEVETASDGDEALEKMKEGDFDVVLLDINMPRMDGIMTLDHIIEDHPDSDVIMLTGFADFTTAIDCLKKGAKDYLVKPIDATELITRLRSLIRARSSEQALENMKKETATIFTDDLLSPLTYSNVLLERVVNGDFGKVTNAQSTYLSYHRELSDQMIETLRSKLDAGQLKSITTEKQKELCNIGSLVKEILNRTTLFAKARGVKLTHELASALPKVEGNPRKLSLAFESAFLVAVEAAPKNSAVHIAITKEGDDKKTVRIAASCKVPAHHLDRIIEVLEEPIEHFQKEFKSMKTQDLRLLLSKWTVELHGGTVLHDLGKRGSVTMIFDLPAASQK